LIFTCVFKIYFSWIYPSIILPLPPFLEQFQQVSFFCFHIGIQITSTTSTLIPPFFVPTPSHWYPAMEKIFFPSCPSFLKIKCILIVQGDFNLILQVRICHDFIKLTPSPPLLTYSLSLRSPNIQQLTIQCIILYSYIDGFFQYFSFSNIFFLFPTFCSVLRQTD
jgi:hypothetical protein